MKVKGLELLISPGTLEEWGSLNLHLEQSLEDLFTKSVFVGYNSSISCYLPDLDNSGHGIPIPKDCHVVLQALERHRFLENLTLVEALAIFRDQGIQVKTSQAVSNMFDKFEALLGILPKLPKAVEDKVRDTRHRLELQRKRRVNTRVKAQLTEKRREKAKLEKAITRQSKEQIKRAKQAMMTQREAIGDTTARLKREAKETRFEEPDVPVENVLFKPTPRQAEFLAAPEKVVFYGGAAGGICRQKQLPSASHCP